MFKKIFKEKTVLRDKETLREDNWNMEILKHWCDDLKKDISKQNIIIKGVFANENIGEHMCEIRGN